MNDEIDKRVDLKCCGPQCETVLSGRLIKPITGQFLFVGDVFGRPTLDFLINHHEKTRIGGESSRHSRFLIQGPHDNQIIGIIEGHGDNQYGWIVRKR